MHERTSRAIARLLFVLSCAVPTVLVVIAIVVTWTPWYHQRTLAELESTLYRETGLLFEIDDFERHAPNQLKLINVRIMEPEMRREVARVRLVWWVHSDRLVIRLSQPEIQSAELAQAWMLLHDRFLCRPELTSTETRLAANDVTIHSRSGSLPLRDLDAWIRPMARSVEAHVQFMPAGSRDDAAPLTVDVVRDRSGELPETTWTMQTGETPLPCSALAEYLPLLNQLGSRATFSGSLVWRTDRDGWSIDLAGSRLTDIELGRMFESLPHRLTGTATIEFGRCQWQPGELVDISGTLHAQHGYIGESLLAALRDHLGFAIAPASDESGPRPYDQLALGFDLNGPHLRLVGTCDALSGHQHLAPKTALCVNGYALAASSGDWMAATSLSRAIAPSHSELIPISGQTNWLMDLILPLKRPLPQESIQARVRGVTASAPARAGEFITQP